MKISRILSPVTALGPGRRVGVWVQGCDLACPGCASTDTWDHTAGQEMSEAEVARMVSTLVRAEQLTGITLSGGEPFQQGESLARVVAQVRTQHPDIDVLVFTGYPAHIARRRSPALFDEADIVIAGRYEQDRPSGRSLVASDNQEVLHLTARGRERMSTGISSRLQVAATHSELFVLGLPGPGDLDRLQTELGRVGIRLEGTSWRA